MCTHAHTMSQNCTRSLIYTIAYRWFLITFLWFLYFFSECIIKKNRYLKGKPFSGCHTILKNSLWSLQLNRSFPPSIILWRNRLCICTYYPVLEGGWPLPDSEFIISSWNISMNWKGEAVWTKKPNKLCTFKLFS